MIDGNQVTFDSLLEAFADFPDVEQDLEFRTKFRTPFGWMVKEEYDRPKWRKSLVKKATGKILLSELIN